jgi:E3 ubiquitin-protein ligase HUWE1
MSAHVASNWEVFVFQLAFDAVMLMWGKKPLSSYGARISESMLAILRHILRGEKIMSVS